MRLPKRWLHSHPKGREKTGAVPGPLPARAGRGRRGQSQDESFRNTSSEKSCVCILFGTKLTSEESHENKSFTFTFSSVAGLPRGLHVGGTSGDHRCPRHPDHSPAFSIRERERSKPGCAVRQQPEAAHAGVAHLRR